MAPTTILSSSTLTDLNLPPLLKERITKVFENSPKNNVDTQQVNQNDNSFILYLPTVVLRKNHNPAFALACYLSNYHNVPLIILAVVLDDTHHLSCRAAIQNAKNIVMTSRRLSFQLEALQYVTKQWEDFGAGVGIRVHGNEARIPHHLTMARRAIAVVTDEPFVHPYLSFVQNVERVNWNTYRVDGSCSVPPNSHLDRRFDAEGKIKSCKGLPDKAWRWEKKTEKWRKMHIHGAVLEGQLDAPKLKVQLEPNFFLSESCKDNLALPSEWKNVSTPCPGRRPWTVTELSSITNIKQWSTTSWSSSVDISVPPCTQTHGSYPAACDRWNTFLKKKLNNYARQRNTIQTPHVVSRMSCYLNFGILSIFQVLYDLEQHRLSSGSNKIGLDKFEQEIIKWREISYAHTFSTEFYNKADVVPSWSLRYLEQCQRKKAGRQQGLSLEQLETGATHDATWNAMQQYLVTTGELHNNARMTWGKTVLHWLSTQHTSDDVVEYMCYLNDRYALDGLSPPSYSGLLWCLGWGDKPSVSGGISEKRTSRYRAGPDGFRIAQLVLLETNHDVDIKQVCKKLKMDEDESKSDNGKTKEDKNKISSYFSSQGQK